MPWPPDKNWLNERKPVRKEQMTTLPRTYLKNCKDQYCMIIRNPTEEEAFNELFKKDIPIFTTKKELDNFYEGETAYAGVFDFKWMVGGIHEKTLKEIAPRHSSD